MNTGYNMVPKVVVCNCSLFTYLFVLHNSCWIKSDDGAIAAFIVPIVAILLV